MLITWWGFPAGRSCKHIGIPEIRQTELPFYLLQRKEADYSKMKIIIKHKVWNDVYYSLPMPVPDEKEIFHNACYVTQQSLFLQHISRYDEIIAMFEIKYKYKSF